MAKEVDYESLEMRIDNFLVLEKAGHFSMAMMIDLMDGLASSYRVSKREVRDMWMDRRGSVDFESSSACIDVHYKAVTTQPD